MPRFLLPHALEHVGGGGIRLAQPVGKVAVDALGVLFPADRQGQHLTLGQAVKTSHSLIGRGGVIASPQMAFADLTKQLAKEALLSATKEPAATPTPPAATELGNIILGQIHAMQKSLKEDEELAVWYGTGPDRIRVFEIYFPAWPLAVLTGYDTDRNLSRVISPVDALQLVAKVVKAPAGAKPGRVGLVTPRAKE